MTRTQYRAASGLVRTNGRTAYRWMDESQQRVMERLRCQPIDRLSDRQDDAFYFACYGVSSAEALRINYKRLGYFDALDMRKL